MTRSTSRLRVVPCSLCAVLVFCWSGIALADDPGNEAVARVLFSEGRRLAANGDYAAACPKFEESFKMDPGIGTSFNLADCWEHVGRVASAWARFLDVAAAAKAGGQSERERVARDRASALEPMLSRMIIDGAHADPGVDITRDGVPVGRASWGLAVPVDSGVHVVEARAPGKQTWSVNVTVSEAGATVSVAIPALDDLPRTPPAGPPRPPAPSPVAPVVDAVQEPPARRLPVSVIALGAVGGAGMVTAAVFGTAYLFAHEDAKAICPTSMNCTRDDQTRHDAKVSEARRDLILDYVALGVGGVAIATAAFIWWRRPPAPPPARAMQVSFRAQPLVWRAGVGTALELVW